MGNLKVFEKILVDNKIIQIEEISFNDGLNFGRFSNNLDKRDFEIQISKKTFVQKLNDFYDVVKSEIRIDDDMYNDTSEFSKVNYCSLEELLDKPKSLFDIFTTYLIDVFFADLQNKNSTYIINTINEIEVEEHILLKGKVYVKN